MKTTALLRFGALVGLVLALFVVFGLPAGTVRAQLAPRDQTDPTVSYDAVRHQYLLVWSEDRGAGHHLFAKRMFDNGLPIGGGSAGEWEITGPTGPMDQKGDQRSPALEGGLLVWSEQVQGGTDYDVYAQRLFDNGRTYGAPMLIAGGPGNQRYPDVVVQDTGWLVVWSQDTSDAGDIWGVRLSQALHPLQAPFAVAQATGKAEDPTIGLDTANPAYFLVMWTDDRNGNQDIYGTRLLRTGFVSAGGPGTQFPVVNTPDNEYAPDYVAFTTKLNDGSLRTNESVNLLLWTAETAAEGANVMGQRWRLNGAPFGPPTVIAGGTGAQAWPAATQPRDGSNGEWLVVWAGDMNGNLDILGRELLLNGWSVRGVRDLSRD